MQLDREISTVECNRDELSKGKGEDDEYKGIRAKKGRDFSGAGSSHDLASCVRAHGLRQEFGVE
jgi:hypothetical protein